MLSFYQWLGKQVDRGDLVGDFAYTMMQFDEPKSRRKRRSHHEVWASWLIDHEASGRVIHAFNNAWQEYQRYMSKLN